MISAELSSLAKIWTEARESATLALLPILKEVEPVMCDVFFADSAVLNDFIAALETHIGYLRKAREPVACFDTIDTYLLIGAVYSVFHTEGGGHWDFSPFLQIKFPPPPGQKKFHACYFPPQKFLYDVPLLPPPHTHTKILYETLLLLY